MSDEDRAMALEQLESLARQVADLAARVEAVKARLSAQAPSRAPRAA